MDPNASIETYAWEDRRRTERHPPLKKGKLHIWRRKIHGGESDIESLYRVLSPDERVRTQRLRFEKQRNEFVLSRGTLRVILACYLEERPEELRFVYSSHGKPSLALTSPELDLRFNVSHSGGEALFAFVRGFDVGVDIEEFRTDVNPRELSERFFSAREQAQLRSLSGDALQRAFFRCWVRKEAFIKAKGQGLSLPLDEFDVSLLENEPAAILGTRPNPNVALCWSLHDLPCPLSHAAALAVETAVFCIPD